LAPDKTYVKVFKNKAYIHEKIIPGNVSWMDDIFHADKIWLPIVLNILPVSTEVSGNDLVLEYYYYNNFSHAGLENANFKNADLRYASFYKANLTNADLSGTDLRMTFLGGADLSNANLSGANLSDTILDEYTILKCINHPICKNG